MEARSPDDLMNVRNVNVSDEDVISAFYSLHHYRYWQCDRVYCCLCYRMALLFGLASRWLSRRGLVLSCEEREHSVELLAGSEGPERCSSPPCAETSLLQP